MSVNINWLNRHVDIDKGIDKQSSMMPLADDSGMHHIIAICANPKQPEDHPS